MPNCPASVSEGFSSTPVKTAAGKDFNPPKSLDGDDGVLTDDEDTFSLLSPIYHDSFDSDEDLERSPAQLTSPGRSEPSGPSGSPARRAGVFPLYLLHRKPRKRGTSESTHEHKV